MTKKSQPTVAVARVGNRWYWIRRDKVSEVIRTALRQRIHFHSVGDDLFTFDGVAYQAVWAEVSADFIAQYEREAVAFQVAGRGTLIPPRFSREQSRQISQLVAKARIAADEATVSS